jgi:Na+/H+-dicarboxylate symporter
MARDDLDDGLAEVLGTVAGVDRYLDQSTTATDAAANAIGAGCLGR